MLSAVRWAPKSPPKGLSRNVTPTKPLVSIGIPVYNGARFIRRALESVVAQDYPNLEIVICDNASTDGTIGICREFAARDPRIRLHVNETNVGILKNFELAIERSRGEYFMWAAYDDQWLPEFVSAMVAKLEAEPRAVVAMSAVERICESGRPYDVVRHGTRGDPSRFGHVGLALRLAAGALYHLYFYGLYRREFLARAFAGFPRLRAGDRIFMMQVALAGRFAYDDRILHVRCVTDANIAEKYAGDDLGRFWRDPFGVWRMLAQAGFYLLSSRVIPAHRKLAIPLLIAVFSLRTIYATALGYGYALAGRALGRHGRRRVGDFARRLLGRPGKGSIASS